MRSSTYTYLGSSLLQKRYISAAFEWCSHFTDYGFDLNVIYQDCQIQGYRSPGLAHRYTCTYRPSLDRSYRRTAPLALRSIRSVTDKTFAMIELLRRTVSINAAVSTKLHPIRKICVIYTPRLTLLHRFAHRSRLRRSGLCGSSSTSLYDTLSHRKIKDALASSSCLGS